MPGWSRRSPTGRTEGAGTATRGGHDTRRCREGSRGLETGRPSRSGAIRISAGTAELEKPLTGTAVVLER